MFGINEIWLLLGIPAFATIILIALYRKETVWWEFLLVWGVSIVAIFISQVAVEKTTVSDKELWGFNSVQAEYEEPFSYWDTCSETYACGESCSGSGNNRSCTTTYCTRYYDCVQHGGDIARLFDQTGKSRRISRAKFKHLESVQWQNTKTKELHRELQYRRLIDDGDLRVTKWPETWQTALPIAEVHTYENRTQCSSTMQFRKVSKEEKKLYNLFEYPFQDAGFETVTIMDASEKHWKLPDQYFRCINGILGPKRFIRTWVLIFRDQPRDILHLQEGYWKNGNKNEFIICIGANKADEIQWGGVISWTEVEELKVEFRDYVETRMGILSDESLVRLADYAEKQLSTRYVKPEFTDKFRHLSVQPSTTAMTVVALIILFINVGVCVLVVANPYSNR